MNLPNSALDDDLYSSLQVTLFRPDSPSGQLVWLPGAGPKRPYNYRTAICEVLGVNKFLTTLFTKGSRFKRFQETRYGIFVISASKDACNSALPVNLIARARLGLTLYGSIIIASAERCGFNQFLYDLGPICPRVVRQFLLSASNRDERPPDYSLIDHRSAPRKLDVGVSVSVDETSREWWESFSDLKKTLMTTVDSDIMENLSAHLREFLNGMVSVWCGGCGAKYRKLRLCPDCQCVAYCDRHCWKEGFKKHQEICHVLVGSDTVAKCIAGHCRHRHNNGKQFIDKPSNDCAIQYKTEAEAEGEDVNEKQKDLITED